MNFISILIIVGLIWLFFRYFQKISEWMHEMFPKIPVFFAGGIALVIVICFLPWGIRTKNHLMQDAQMISSVEIIRVDGYEDLEGKFYMKYKGRIEDLDWFLEEFQKIPCKKHRYSTAKYVVGVDNAVFKITYYNGEYELIDYRSRMLYTYKDGYKERRNLRLDRKQYRALLKDCIVRIQEDVE